MNDSIQYVDLPFIKMSFQNGKLCSIDGKPAVKTEKLEAFFDENGKLHRENGPAVDNGGLKKWYKNGEMHREDGPATTLSFDKGLTFEEVEYRINGRRHRDDGPAVEHGDGRKEWYKDGEIHRENGPAIIYPDGSEEWYYEGVFHREDGPARILSNGLVQYFIHGHIVKKERIQSNWKLGL